MMVIRVVLSDSIESAWPIAALALHRQGRKHAGRELICWLAARIRPPPSSSAGTLRTFTRSPRVRHALCRTAVPADFASGVAGPARGAADKVGQGRQVAVERGTDHLRDGPAVHGRVDPQTLPQRRLDPGPELLFLHPSPPLRCALNC